MPDDEPISTTVPETTTISTGADKETLGNINKEFSDFWAEQDSQSGTAPAAPGEEVKEDKGAAQETKESKPEIADSEREPTTKEPAKEPGPREYTDEEIDKLEPRNPYASTQVSEDFKQIRDHWKQDRVRLKEQIEKATKLEQELSEARQNAWTPEQKADYDNAAQLRRRFDLASDPEFISRYQRPITSHYQNILQEAVEALPDKNAAVNWAKHMWENYTPDQLDRQWWQEKVLSKIPDEMDRQSLLSSVTEMLRMQRDRDNEMNNRSLTPESYSQWVKERDEGVSQKYQQEIESEIREQEKRIQEYLPRDVEKAKTREERRAIEEHNARFNDLNNHFKSVLQDIGNSGPRAWVRASLEATRAKILDTEYKNLEKDYKQACVDRDKYKNELDKITGVRRKISNTSGTPPTTTKKDGGLSLKDLDVRKSFDRFDWGET